MGYFFVMLNNNYVTQTQDGSQPGLPLTFRKATLADVPAMAALGALNYESEGYWRIRIAGYMKNEFNPYQSLYHRLVYVAIKGETIIGFVAGHLTCRKEYIGHIQWICVGSQHARMGIGSKLLLILFNWFIEHDTFSTRADVEPHQTILKQFYKKHGAESLNNYWLFWNVLKVA